MKNRFSSLSLCLYALMLTFTHSSFADISINGFASIRATYIDSDTGQSTFSRFDDVGDISLDDESLAAVQASIDLSDRWSATVQMITEGKDDFDIEARWAYLSYKLADSHTLNIGKLANPIFYQSQYDRVGYAHNFGRLPLSVYDDLDFLTLLGASLNSSFFINDYLLETKFTYGNEDGRLFTESFGVLPTDLEEIFSVNIAISRDWWKVFAGGFVSTLDTPAIDSRFRELFAGSVEQAIATGASEQQVNTFNDFIRLSKKEARYWFAGFSTDYQNWLIDYEYVNYQIEDSADAENQAWYLAIGYRFGKSTVTLHTEDSDQTANFADPNRLGNETLIALANSTSAAGIERTFDGSGVTWRYDFHSSAALKLDYYRGEDARASVGDFEIASIGIDLVF